jgi:predicted TIM-barrel fold metal-dependent hydrolase
MLRLKKFPQLWISASEPYEISLEGSPYRDTWPCFTAIYQEFGAKQLIWGTSYPRPRWELPMEKKLGFVDSSLDFYTTKNANCL